VLLCCQMPEAPQVQNVGVGVMVVLNGVNFDVVSGNNFTLKSRYFDLHNVRYETSDRYKDERRKAS